MRKKEASPRAQQKPKRKRLELTEEQECEIKEAFDLFDMEQTMSISYHELKVILRALGFEVRKSEVVQLAREYDREETGRVGFEDFAEISSICLYAVKKKYSERDPIEEAIKAFRLFDEDNTGRISLRNLKKIARELGESLTEEELAAMIEEFDRDQDGESTLAAYCSQRRGVPRDRPADFDVLTVIGCLLLTYYNRGRISSLPTIRL